MFINFIAFIICAAFAIYYAIEDRVEVCIFEAVLALINLPFVINWLASLFS